MSMIGRWKGKSLKDIVGIMTGGNGGCGDLRYSAAWRSRKSEIAPFRTQRGSVPYTGSSLSSRKRIGALVYDDPCKRALLW